MDPGFRRDDIRPTGFAGASEIILRAPAKAGAVKDRRRPLRCVSGSMEALHSDGKPGRIANVSKPKACVDGAARTGFSWNGHQAGVERRRRIRRKTDP